MSFHQLLTALPKVRVPRRGRSASVAIASEGETQRSCKLDGHHGLGVPAHCGQGRVDAEGELPGQLEEEAHAGICHQGMSISSCSTSAAGGTLGFSPVVSPVSLGGSQPSVRVCTDSALSHMMNSLALHELELPPHKHQNSHSGGQLWAPTAKAPAAKGKCDCNTERSVTDMSLSTQGSTMQQESSKSSLNSSSTLGQFYFGKKSSKLHAASQNASNPIFCQGDEEESDTKGMPGPTSNRYEARAAFEVMQASSNKPRSFLSILRRDRRTGSERRQDVGSDQAEGASGSLPAEEKSRARRWWNRGALNMPSFTGICSTRTQLNIEAAGTGGPPVNELPVLSPLDFEQAGFPHCDTSSEGSRVVCGSHVEDVLVAAQDQRWHVLCCSPEMFGSHRVYECLSTPEGGGNPFRDPAFVHEGVAATLVLTELDALEETQQLVRHVRERNGEIGPLIVVLLMRDGEGVPENIQPILQAQNALFSNDVDDVILKTGTGNDLRASVAMAIVRSQFGNAAREEMEYELHSQYEKRLQVIQRAAGEERGAHRPQKEAPTFWQSVHQLLTDFPKMEESVTKRPAPGEQVGPCTLQFGLGRGRFGEVFAATNVQTGGFEAVKVLKKSELGSLKAVNSAWKEVTLMKRLKHENIVELHGAVHGPEHIFLRMQMAGRRTLFAALVQEGHGRFTPQLGRHFQVQLARAVAYCHQSDVAHRDIKPENIAIDDDGNRLFVLDFGRAVTCGKKVWDNTGTMPFIAPEVFPARSREAYFPAPTDVWSCGIVLLEMLCGVGKLNEMLCWAKGPSINERHAEELENYFAREGAIQSALEQDLGYHDESLVQLLEGMLTVNPEERMPSKDVEAHPWLAAMDATDSIGPQHIGGSSSIGMVSDHCGVPLS